VVVVVVVVVVVLVVVAVVVKILLIVVVVIVVVVVVVAVVQYNIFMPISKRIFNLKHKYMCIQYSCKNINVKIWICK
jgi:hypothetical protein